MSNQKLFLYIFTVELFTIKKFLEGKLNPNLKIILLTKHFYIMVLKVLDAKLVGY